MIERYTVYHTRGGQPTKRACPHVHRSAVAAAQCLRHVWQESRGTPERWFSPMLVKFEPGSTRRILLLSGEEVTAIEWEFDQYNRERGR